MHFQVPESPRNLRMSTEQEEQGEIVRRMSTEQEVQGEQATLPPTSLIAKIEERYRNSKDHLEKYPYVWASYAVVYGGFGLYLAYRWRKLRKTEDRVRVLQEQLRKLTEAEAKAEELSRPISSAQKISSSAASSSFSSVQKATSSADKPV